MEKGKTRQAYSKQQNIHYMAIEREKNIDVIKFSKDDILDM